MKITTPDPFWRRMGLLHPVVRASVVGGVALAVLVGGMAALAQHAAQVDARAQGLSGTYTYSLTGHTLAMVLVGALSVAVAVALLRTESRFLAGTVLLATALGPMTLVAAPARAGFVSADQMDTKPWWHAVVGLAVAAVLAGWTSAVVRTLPHSSGRVRVPAEASVLTAVTAVGFVVIWNKSLEPLESVGLLPAAGWAALAGGLLVAVARGGRWAGALPLALACATLLAMFGAYHRQSGWPGVAGWEFNGMQSPVVLSTAAAITLLSAAAAAPVLGFLRRRASSRPEAQQIALTATPAG